jgi:hypothetical protein
MKNSLNWFYGLAKLVLDSVGEFFWLHIPGGKSFQYYKNVKKLSPLGLESITYQIWGCYYWLWYNKSCYIIYILSSIYYSSIIANFPPILLYTPIIHPVTAQQQRVMIGTSCSGTGHCVPDRVLDRNAVSWTKMLCPRPVRCVTDTDAKFQTRTPFPRPGCRVLYPDAVSQTGTQCSKLVQTRTQCAKPRRLFRTGMPCLDKII